MVRYLFYTIGDLTYQSPLVERPIFLEIPAWAGAQTAQMLERLATGWTVRR